MKYRIRKIIERGDNLVVQIELQESCAKYDEGDRIEHALPKSFDWEARNPRTGNTYLYERIQKIVRQKTAEPEAKVQNIQKWQNLQFDSDY